MVRWLRCSSQSIVVYHFYSQLVLPPYTVKVRGGRHSTTHEEGSSGWALVLPPNTIKIRGGRSIFLRHSQARVLPSHAVKTGRGRSTWYQAHVLPPYAVKTRGGRSVFYHGHGEVHLSSMRFVTSLNHSSPPIQVKRLYSGSKTLHHSNAAKPTSSPYCSMIAASSTKLRAKYIQKRTWSKACILHKLCMTAVTKDGRW